MEAREAHSGVDLASLLERARAGDAEARGEIVAANLRLVWHVVRRFPQGVLDHQDLFQVGCIGLLKAVERFDPRQNVSFSTYAVPLILGEIRRFLRDDGPVKVGREARRRARLAQKAARELEMSLGRAPSAAEVAAAVDMDAAELAALLEATREPLSLQGPAYQGGDGDDPALEERVGGEPWPAPDDWEEAAALRAVMARLPRRERLILEWRYFGDQTQAEVARALGLSQVQVSRLERRALAALREMLLDS